MLLGATMETAREIEAIFFGHEVIYPYTE